jgi:aminoglycoside phosphotransferase (APT) family kinase protein
VLTWVREHLDRPLAAVAPVPGGRTDTIWAVRTEDGDPVILRWMPLDRWGETGRRHVGAEALGCLLLAPSGLPTPRLLASDPDGDATGACLNLTTWLPGQVRLDPLGPAAVDTLARAAVVIHATPAPTARRPPAYRFWGPVDPTVPPWTGQPELWQRALELTRQAPPATAPGLVHRDFHPGNVLWQGDALSGVIDWAETSWGPPELDVAHSCTNFALLHGRDSAAAFLRAYRRFGGLLEADPDAALFWVLSDLVGFLPDPVPELAALLSRRPDLTPELLRHRLDALLVEVLAPPRR